MILSILLAGITLTLSAQDAGKEILYPTYKGLIMAGYQGWFRADGDPAGNGWGHYGRGDRFDAEHNTIDIWPDVSEYKKTYKTSFTYPDGSRGEVFSSLDKSTTDLHFKWMKEYQKHLRHQLYPGEGATFAAI